MGVDVVAPGAVVESHSTVTCGMEYWSKSVVHDPDWGCWDNENPKFCSRMAVPENVFEELILTESHAIRLATFLGILFGTLKKFGGFSTTSERLVGLYPPNPDEVCFRD